MNYSETSWKSFYVDRVNNLTYLEHFYKKYKPLIDFIDNKIFQNENIIVKEEGCGIGNVTKAHYYFGQRKPKKYILSDIDSAMIELAKMNTFEVDTRVEYLVEDILVPKEYENNTLVVTHGVLEHFSNEQIKVIINNQSKALYSCHYVPTNGYDKPSFGDERLLCLSDWLNLIEYKAKDFVNNKDLFLFL